MIISQGIYFVMAEEQIIQDQKIEKESTSDDIQAGGAESLIPDAASAEDLKILEEMMRAGLMYGHKKSKTNPKFQPYIYITRNGIEIIDLMETLQALEKAVEFLKTEIKAGGTILMVATQPAAKETVENLAKKFNFSYVSGKWIGGLLTNFKVISRRIEYWKKLQSDSERGRLDKYTKKERVMINRNIERMRRMFTGLENLDKLPDVLFVIDASIKNHGTALREAHRLKIKTIGIIDSDDNPELVDYPIPANDHTKTSIDWIINKITEGMQSDANTRIHANDTNTK